MRFKISLTLFVLGLAGVFSLLFTPFPLDYLPKEVMQEVPLEALPYLALINPTLLLLVAVLIGHTLTVRVQLTAPLLTALFHRQPVTKILLQQLKHGMLLGAIAAVGIVLISKWSEPLLPQAFLEAGSKFHTSPMTKFLYGGIAEEIHMRWGLMTLFVWLAWKAFARSKAMPPSWLYCFAIVVAALVFGIGHLPIVFLFVKHPTIFLIGYIVLTNALLGLFAGWLFWRKGLEAAMFAHMTAHAIFLGLG